MGCRWEVGGAVAGNGDPGTVALTQKPGCSGPRLPRGRVTVFPNWCKGCGLCVEFCPAGVLEQGHDGVVIIAHPERCRACRWCELHCPDFAIFITDLAEGTTE
ncbi:MAG: 4Fe-4S binding protein [Chloroflexi bacterium]|nr:4Fe-4S binding protein [Chloroflexota bacterium]